MKIRQLDLQSLLYQVNGLSVDHQIAMRVIRALENNALEIEGYERSDWTRFDPKDLKTIPPSGGFLGYFTGQCGDKYQDVHFRNNEYTDEEFATRMVYHKLTHWRPLPNDPVEKEGTK